MYTNILFKNTKDCQFRALDFDLAHKNEVNRVGCTTRNRLDFDLAHKNEANRASTALLSSRSQKVLCFWQNKSYTLILLIKMCKISVYEILFKKHEGFSISSHAGHRNRASGTPNTQGCSQKQLKKCQKHDSFRRFVPPKRRRDAMRCATAGRPNVWFHFKAHFCTCFWRFFLYLWPGTWRVLIQWRAELPMCPKSWSASASKLPDTWPGAEKYIKKARVFDDLIWNHTFERQMPRSVSFDAHDLGGANRRKASCF